jgi:AcrR family transcriptional regulator
MLAIRHEEDPARLTLHRTRESRSSIGARRNPASTRAILEAAESILVTHGLSGLSMDAIARAARCGKPTLYRWWPDKASLLADLHERALVASRPVATDPQRSPTNRLTDQWLEAWESTLAGIALRGMLAEAQSCDAARQVLIERGFAPYRSDLAATLELEIDDPRVEQGIDDLLVPMLGELIVGSRLRRPRATQSTVGVRSVAVSGSVVTAESDPAPAPISVRDRSEWVD